MRRMVVETVLARNITAVGEKEKYDAACKRLLANKVILAWIMKSCVGEFKDFSVDEIAEKYIEGMPQVNQAAVNPDEEAGGSGKERGGGWNGQDVQIAGLKNEDASIQEGTVIYDVRFYAIVPQTGVLIKLFLNVEIQNDFYPGYPIIKRGVYYCSRMISSQYGTEFTEGHYEKISKVYSIWICVNRPKYRENTIAEYSIQEHDMVGIAAEKKENYDLMTVVMICLGNSEDDKYDGILKLLDVLLSSEKNSEEKKRILQEEFDIKMTKELEGEVLRMCNLSEGVERKGIEKGIEKERIRGIGILIQNLKSLAISEEMIVEKLMSGYQLSAEAAKDFLGEQAEIG